MLSQIKTLFIQQIKANWITMVFIMTVLSLIFGFVFALHTWGGVPFKNLTIDVSIIASEPPYIGFLSQLGLLVWSATVSICLLGASLIYYKDKTSESLFFLITAGLLTSLLTLDDAFLFHEKVLPHIGIPELMVYLSYGGFLLFFLIRFHWFILGQTDFLLLGIALFFFGASVSTDTFSPFGINEYVLEDGSKFAGIVAWFFYFLQTCRKLLIKTFSLSPTMLYSFDNKEEIETMDS
jgi:hypothetical protein